MRLPAGGSHNDSGSDLLYVGQKFREGQRHGAADAGRAKGSSVSFVNQIAGLLEFDRKIESCRSVDALEGCACRIGATTRDLIGPESHPGCIGLAIKKVNIVLAHEERRVVDRV